MGIRFHDLRHAFASMLIPAGCSVKAVSAALGHSAAATTLNLYSHLWRGDEDRIRGPGARPAG
jgi:integrase